MNMILNDIFYNQYYKYVMKIGTKIYDFASDTWVNGGVRHEFRVQKLTNT